MNRALGLLVHNWPLKVLAIILAFLLYAGLVVSQSTFEYPGAVRIDVVNLPLNAVVLDQLPNVTRIRYIANGDVGAGPTPQTWQATIDLAGVDPKAGTVHRAAVDVTSTDPRFIVIDFEPRALNVHLDPYATYNVPVRVDTGETPADLEVGDPVLSQKNVNVSGPDSVVKYVVEARADVAIDPHGLTVDRDVPLIPVDRSGNEVTEVRVDPQTVHVKIDVFTNAQTKPLPVHPVVTGTPPAGYLVGTVTVDPVSILAKGDAANLASVTAADTQPIPLGAATSTIQADVALALPDGVVAIDVQTVHVTVEVKPEDGTRTYQAGLVLTGNQPGMAYAMSTLNAAVTIGGPVADLDRLNAAGFTVPVDVAGLGPGTHQVELAPILQAGLRLLRVDPAAVSVTVTATGGPGASGTPP